MPPSLAGTSAVLLGDTSPAGGSHKALTAELFAGDRWLAVDVNGQALTPWLRVGAAPFATNAAAVGGFPASADPVAGALLALGTDVDRVQIGAGLSGDGTSANPLVAPAQPPTLGRGLSGNGTAASPLTVTLPAFSGVAVDAPLTGTGTASSHLGLALVANGSLTGDGTTATPLQIAYGGTGSATTAARSDHAHAGSLAAGQTTQQAG